jgi:hypothetical protein
MRFVVAKRSSRRGAGLGNEIFPWAKGWIASQVLDAHLVGPSWGINQRRYFRNFETSRLDFLLEDGLLRLPHYEFTEADFRAAGDIDFGVAIKRWADSKGLTNKSCYIVSVEGMWGGYVAIRTAREFLQSQLLTSRNALSNVFQITSGLDHSKLFVAVHMRSTEFGFITPEHEEDVRGKFNIFVPSEWYLSVCTRLQQRFGDRIQFHIFTDRPSPEFVEMVRRFNPGQITQTAFTECSDLLLMAQADLRVCSVSSYSLAANFLSDGPFVWYEPQLTLADGHYVLWGDRRAQLLTDEPVPQKDDRTLGSVTVRKNPRSTRSAVLGTAMNAGEPVPDALAALLEQKLSCHNPETNLLEYGSVPQL